MLTAQSTFLPTGSDWHFFVERLEIMQGRHIPQIHTSLKPFERKAIITFLEQSYTNPVPLTAIGQPPTSNVQHPIPNSQQPTPIDLHLIDRLLQSHPEWSSVPSDSTPGRGGWLCTRIPITRHVYAYPSDFIRYQSDEFFVSVNPVLDLQVGREQGADKPLYRNTRGMEMRGMISGRVGFYTFLAENQARLPGYVDDHRRAFYSGAIPGDGWAKAFKDGGVDYFTARGYISLEATRHIGLQFGQDKLRIGSGIRSLLLSDFSNNYLFLRVSTRYRFFQYQNTWARLTDYPMRTVGRAYDTKYSITHHLSLNLGGRFQLGLFENVTTGRSDPSGRRGLDPHYLNPIIFYRAIEHHVGDPDKVAVGLDWRWLATPGLSFYGQAYIDEFRINDIRDDLDSLLVRAGLRKERKREGYASFANKFAVQLGTRVADPFGIQNLDLQAEINLVRPYVYTHWDTSGQDQRPGASYTHYSQPLAHPLGANFREWALYGEYRPHHRVTLSASYIQYVQGRDADGLNYGGNILKDYHFGRPQPESAYFLDGVRTSVSLLEFGASWQFWPGWHLEGRYLTRSEEVESVSERVNIVTVGVRVNAVGRRDYL